MNAGILDTITTAFVAAIGGATITLTQQSLKILAVAALLAYCVAMWPLVLSQGEALGSFLLIIVRIGIFYWLCVGLAALALAAFDSFVVWGTMPSGGRFGAADFLHPSRTVDLGFKAVWPLEYALAKMSGMPTSWHLLITYTLAKVVIIVAFGCVAFHLMMTLIEFHLAVMAGTILVPWGILGPTSFLAEFALSWITAGLIRVFLTVVIMSISVPLFETLKMAETPGGDPTAYSAFIFAITAGIFALLAWQVPKRAAQVGGRGMALALGGEVLAHGAQTGYRAVLTAAGGIGQAVRGTSRLMQAARG